MDPSETKKLPHPDATAVHSELRARFERAEQSETQRSDRLSFVRLGTFLVALVLLAAGIASGDVAVWAPGAVFAVLFIGAVIAQRRVIARVDAARTRKEVHERHLRRMRGELDGLAQGKGLIPESHPYARDIDVIGEGSLFQRIDVTHTVHGSHTLAAWLAAPASIEVIRARQVAMLELAHAPELRQELEATALEAGDGELLDGRPFRAFAELPSYFAAQRSVAFAIFLLPAVTLALYLLGAAEVLPKALWLVPVAAQLWLISRSGKAVQRAFDLAAARQSTVESFERMLRFTENARFESPLLRELQARLLTPSKQAASSDRTEQAIPPSAQVARLRTWVSWGGLRHQFLLHIVVNPLTLWDLHVLRGLEAWNRDVGKRTGEWFAALGELEALSSLATLAYGDPNAILPQLEREGGLSARGLCHPLLTPDQRVANDLELGGSGCALVITGSNMAGKSTLLRAIGQNVALALAGGPVCASAMRLPVVRVRASMRIDDSLQRGASYFHAELSKLKSVIEDADQAPPVLFLLDELLRGTNAQARHLGGKAVIAHLLDRGSFGVVATHDIALSTLEDERPGRVQNQHFTDVIVEGEMRFDYKLRPGVVRTSNALRLLTLAGIAVPGTDQLILTPLELHGDGTEKRSEKRENA